MDASEESTADGYEDNAVDPDYLEEELRLQAARNAQQHED